MTIINNGNVGIGTTTPIYKLDISGGLRTTGLVRADGGLTTDVTTLVSNLNADLLDS